MRRPGCFAHGHYFGNGDSRVSDNSGSPYDRRAGAFSDAKADADADVDAADADAGAAVFTDSSTYGRKH